MLFCDQALYDPCWSNMVLMTYADSVAPDQGSHYLQNPHRLTSVPYTPSSMVVLELRFWPQGLSRWKGGNSCSDLSSITRKALKDKMHDKMKYILHFAVNFLSMN